MIDGDWRHDPKREQDQARDPNTSPEQLAVLARSPFSFVLTAVAVNSRTPTETLASLVPAEAVAHADQERLDGLARNPSTDSATLTEVAGRLAGHLNGGRGNQVAFGAGIALFVRPDTPFEVLVRLASDGTTSREFRKVAARESRRLDVIELLSADRSERVRLATTKHK